MNNVCLTIPWRLRLQRILRRKMDFIKTFSGLNNTAYKKDLFEEHTELRPVCNLNLIITTCILLHLT